MDGENSRMEEDEYNRRVREKWKESVRRWEEMDREHWHYGSPGRKERKEKKTKLENHWLLLRECAAFIKENTNTWETRVMEETKRIREEERKERILLAGRKKKLYDEKRGKKKKASGDVDGKLESGVEDKYEIKRKMNERLEIAEYRKNLWKEYRVDGNFVKPAKALNKSKKKKMENHQKKEEKMDQIDGRKKQKL